MEKVCFGIRYKDKSLWIKEEGRVVDGNYQSIQVQFKDEKQPKQITTELRSTSGDILVLGHNAKMEPTVVKSFLGVVPQEVGLFEYLTCYQHLHILLHSI